MDVPDSSLRTRMQVESKERVDFYRLYRHTVTRRSVQKSGHFGFFAVASIVVHLV